MHPNPDMLISFGAIIGAVISVVVSHRARRRVADLRAALEGHMLDRSCHPRPPGAEDDPLWDQPHPLEGG